MAFFDFSEPLIDQLTHRLRQLAQRWDLKPAALIEALKLWCTWSGLTWLAFGVSLLFIEVGERKELSVVDGLIGGALVGLAQWLALKSHIRNAHQWILVSALSWGALALFQLGAIGWMAPETPILWIRAVMGLFYGAYVGAGLGAGQWWVIKKQVDQAWRWIPLMSGIWAIAIAIGWTIGGELRIVSHLFVSEVVGLGLAWGAIATLSGLAIVKMLYQSNRQISDETSDDRRTLAAAKSNLSGSKSPY